MKKLLLTLCLITTALGASAWTAEAYSLTQGQRPAQIPGRYKVTNAAASVLPLADEDVNLEPVTTRPEGTSEFYSRNSIGYVNVSGYIAEKVDRGLAVELITAEDGTVWMNNPFSTYNCESWLKCTREGDVLTLALPQPVTILVYGGKEYTYFASRLAYDSDSQTFFTTTDQNYTFKIDGDKIVDTTNGDLLGMTIYDIDLSSPVEKYIYKWTGYGDYYLEMEKHEAEPIVAPEGLDMELWALVTDTDGHKINVGFDEENNIWIQGILSSLPYAWTKGEASENGLINFASEQYLGIDPINRHFTYFMGGKTDVRHNFEEDYDYEVQVVIPSLTMRYYPEKKRLVANEGENLLVTTNTIARSQSSGLAFIYLYKNPRLKYQNRVSDVPPRPMIITSYLPYRPETLYGSVAFDFPVVDMEDMLVEPARLYYEVLVDDEPFTFYPDEYRILTKPTRRIGFYFADGYDFMCEGVDHIFYFFFEGAESIKIRSVYVEGSKEVPSEWVEAIPGVGAVDEIEGAHGTPVRTEYFDLTGQRIGNPSGTICIARDVYSDGTVRTRKQIAK